MPKSIKHLLSIIGGLAVVFLILDFNYLKANILFDLGRVPHSAAPVVLAEQATGAPSSVNILSLGISAPVVYISGNTEAGFQTALAQGVVHYPGTALPGQAGNCYLFGHSSDFFWKPGNYKNVFALLPKIAVGAKISITGQSGNSFIYTVTKSYKVASNDLSVLGQSTNGNKILTLQTSYPVGTALARWIVVAQMR